MNAYRSVILTLGACVSLSACQTISVEAERSSIPEKAVARAAEKRSLAEAEKLYKQRPDDELLAADYARALREEGRSDRAALVLGPFATGKKPAALTLAEYSSIQITLGDYKRAEKFARKAIAADQGNFRAYQNLGVALDAQAKHQDAEKAFRKGLEIWQGDPVPIMNNLALNLASQGYLDEAIDILRRAQAMAPDRVEIERNVRIVTALQQAARGPTPTPPRKPVVSPKQ